MPNSTLITLLFLLLIIKIYVANSSSSSPSSICDNNGKVIFNFPKFKPSNCKKGGELLCMGAVNPGEGYLNLTTVSSNNTSTDDFNGIARVLYHNSLQIWPTSFCTSFSFKIFPRLDQVFTGDGMTFVIAPNNHPSPHSSFGSYLGLQDSKLAGKSEVKQLAIEFDTFKNEWDPDGNHIGIDTTSVMTSLVARSLNSSNIYLAEISTIGRLRHKNILILQGWCHENEHLLLVYDFMSNGSLQEFLTGRRFLNWKTRNKILSGLASALLYLHEECGDPVVHRDVKPSNVMLDFEFNAHLGDFGLARLLRNAAGVTTMVAGTLGYMAPEVSYTGKATTESDVYSFGVVVLEVVCGKRFNNLLGESCLVDYVWDMHVKGLLIECVDPNLKGEFDKDQATKLLSVSLACLHLDANMRPNMRKVVQVVMNPDEPPIELPDTRPDGVYVSLYGFSNPPSVVSSSPITALTIPNYSSTRDSSDFESESLAR